MKRISMRAVAVGGDALPPRASRGESGMVLLEAALAIPALVAIAAAMVWALGVAAVSLELGDAARAAARDLARGVPVDAAIARAQAEAPAAQVTLAGGGDMAAVELSQFVSAPVPILDGLGITVTQRVAIPREWA